MTYTWIILINIGLALFWGFIANAIGSSKNVKGFLWGFFLGIFGVIIVCLLPDKSNIYQPVTKIDNVNDRYEALERLAKLRDSGAITQKEFQTEKEKLLQK